MSSFIFICAARVVHAQMQRVAAHSPHVASLDQSAVTVVVMFVVDDY
jgi:hypothetical protein